MKYLEFFVQGTPKAQPRVKACVRGKHAAVYTPGTASEWKSLVRAEAIRAWDKVRFVGPVTLTTKFFLKRPKSHFNSKGELKPNAPEYCISRPDFDNYAKAIADTLTDINIWDDDSQVARHTFVKRYSIALMGCEISILEINP